MYNLNFNVVLLELLRVIRFAFTLTLCLSLLGTCIPNAPADGEAAAAETRPAAFPTGQLPQQPQLSPKPQQQPVTGLSAESPCDIVPDGCRGGGFGRGPAGPEGALSTEALGRGQSSLSAVPDARP